MKNLLKFSVLTIIGAAFSVTISAQNTATATAAATIVSPIGISKDVDMNFGNVLAGGAGTAILTPAGGTSGTGGVSIPPNAGTVTAASFTVTGTTGFTYSVTLPAGATTITRVGGGTMTVDTWTCNKAANVGTIDGTALTVGATLHVAAGQTPGDYSSENVGGSGPFTVQVDYN